MRIYSRALPCLLAAPMLLLGDDDDRNGCRDLPGHSTLRTALRNVVVQAGTPNGGLDNNMWASLVDRDGVVCAVVFSGSSRGDQWPGSRVISAQKANAGNAFSLPTGSAGIFPGLPLSTANLYAAVQPGGSLFGLQHSNPVDTRLAYGGDSSDNGTDDDDMIGGKIGGVNVFGGGLALYNAAGRLLGALGVSGDTSCTDHAVAWKVRHALNLDNVPTGVAPGGTDNIIHDIVGGVSASGFGHPKCINTPDPAALLLACPKGPAGALPACTTAILPVI